MKAKNKKTGKFIDLVLGGPDMSGTSTRINDLILYSLGLGMKVRDMRGTEIDALFHADIFKELNTKHRSLKDFMLDKKVAKKQKNFFLNKTHELLSGGETNADLKVGSCVENNVSTFIDPNKADVWIFEEPTKRGAGQVNRAMEQQRSQYGSKMDPISAAYCHNVYRIDEYLRFRRPLRETGGIIIRSRSEETGCCYQIKDKNSLPQGIDEKTFLCLPGHKVAFGNPPTHIFIACAPANWTKEDYITLRKERSSGRLLDDHELNSDYIILVNKRYATNWLEKLYEKGCKQYGSKPPKIIRFNMLLPKEEIKAEMEKAFNKIMEENL